MLLDIIGFSIFNLCTILFLHNLNNKKTDLKDSNIFLSFLFLEVISFLGLLTNVYEIETFLKILVLLFSTIYIMKLDESESVLSLGFFYLLNIFIELLILTFFIFGLKITSYNEISECIEFISYNIYVSFVINFISAICIFVISKIKYILKIYNVILSFIETKNIKKVIRIISFVFSIIAMTYVILCYSNNVFLTTIMFIVFIIIILYVVYNDISVRTEYEKTKEKYSSVKESLLEYEDMIDKYRVNNHENKNQLLIIQNMIKNKDKKINEYIDNLVGNVYMTNEKIMMDVSIIPAGGLRATIHSKLNIMDNKKIKYILNIDRKLRTIDFDNIDSDLNLKICKIVSIFIDNAIDEVDTHKTDKVVNIEMYVDNNKLVLEVSNKFKNNFDVERIYEQKYTTKEDGHGYGLTLAKELISSESCLNNYQKIEDDLFTQILEIKIKK